ncbi:hypothetical protein [uncultured Campylobacter sp.]|uniref:hypothetical protein n=1 Tax=uncultured Campylobacter sp. TaxID=218934 RepID=UPI002631A21B|nr:hypothetical protein [uncultured Campylobacter sp.]
MKKNIILILFSLFLYGCEGRECLSASNKNAIALMLKNLDKNITHSWACFFNRCDINIYGLSRENDTELFLKNIDNVKKLENINVKVNVYKQNPKTICKKNNEIKSCKIEFKEKPFLKITIDNTKR